MNLSILIPSIVGLVVAVPMLILGLRMISGNRLFTIRHVKPKVVAKPVEVKKIEKSEEKKVTLLDIAQKHEQFLKGET